MMQKKFLFSLKLTPCFLLFRRENQAISCLKIAHSDMIGLRPTMEDAFGIVTPFKGSGGIFIGLYDGHGGREVASLSAQKHPGILEELLEEEEGKGEGERGDEGGFVEVGEKRREGLKKSFFQLNAAIEKVFLHSLFFLFILSILFNFYTFLVVTLVCQRNQQQKNSSAGVHRRPFVY